MGKRFLFVLPIKRQGTVRSFLMTVAMANPTSVNPPLKPRMRGVLHELAAFMALGAGLVMTAMAPSRQAAIAAAIYSTCLVLMFAASALYHRPTWSPRIRAWLRRLDHSAIFLLIAGTGTPLALLALHGAASQRFLVTTWLAAGLGIAQSLLWPRAPKLIVVGLYLMAGWLALAFWPLFEAALAPGALALIVAGGVFYSAGAVIYAFKRPNPFPSLFGYHEIFHAFTLLATFCHFAVVLAVVSHA